MIVRVECWPGEREIYSVSGDDSLQMRCELADRLRQIILGMLSDALRTGHTNTMDFACFHEDAATVRELENAKDAVPR
jgi:hypothetical protein